MYCFGFFSLILNACSIEIFCRRPCFVFFKTCKPDIELKNLSVGIKIIITQKVYSGSCSAKFFGDPDMFGGFDGRYVKSNSSLNCFL